MSVESLLIEAETLDLGEVDAGRFRRHVERRMPDDRLIAEILGCEEDKLLLAEVNLHLALDRLESPRQTRRNVAVKPHRDNWIGDRARVEVRSLRRSAVSR